MDNAVMAWGCVACSGLHNRTCLIVAAPVVPPCSHDELPFSTCLPGWLPCALLCTPAGKELQSDHDTVQSSGLRNRACLIVAERSKANDFTRSPSEYRPSYELYSYTWMFAQAVSIVY